MRCGNSSLTGVGARYGIPARIRPSRDRATRLATMFLVAGRQRWHPSHAQEVDVQDAKHGKPTSQFPLSNPLGEIFAHNANLWFATHAELLTNVDALTHAWLHRRREGVEAMREAIQQMTECSDPAEMLRVQQEWLSGAFRRANEDITALNNGISSLTRKANTDFERAARKVAEPPLRVLYPVEEVMLMAAGNKPIKDQSAA